MPHFDIRMKKIECIFQDKILDKKVKIESMGGFCLPLNLDLTLKKKNQNYQNKIYCVFRVFASLSL